MILCHVPRAGIEHRDIVDFGAEEGIQMTELDSELWCKGVCTEHSPKDDYNRAMAYV